MFCPNCGCEGEDFIDGLCLDCYLKNAKSIELPPKISVTRCAHCHATLQGIKWTYEDLDDIDIIYDALEEAIKINPIFEDSDVSMEIIQIRGTIAECIVELKSKINDKDIYDEAKTNVYIQKAVCPDCSKRSSGYFESVIQLRADKRKLSEEEIKTADETIKNNLEKLYPHDRLAYMPNRAILKEGIDYYIGSYKSAKKLLLALKNRLGGTSKESARLISQDRNTGKGLYRMWISLRLPTFKIGDLIEYHDKLLKITSYDSRKIYYSDLKTFEKNSIVWNDYDDIELIKKSDEIAITGIISKSPKKIQILDPESYEVIDIDLNDEIAHLNIGDEVNAFKFNNVVYIFPKDD